MMSIGVVIPAAGQGSRMNSQTNKQYLGLADRPVLAHTIALFSDNPQIKEIIVVVRQEEIKYCRKKVINKYFNNKKIRIIAGGETRRESVFAGLRVFSPAINYVIIHDGARPILPVSVVERVILTVKENDAVSVGVKPKNTIKRVDGKGNVLETLDRGELVSIQTPQAFTRELIMKAHQEVASDLKVTDDAALVEFLGYQVKIISGSEENIKITTPEDIFIAESILENRRR
ncbi:MAG: 2-C-methyl-D-erythritol 4-phosphate cytidylyltransferase [Firmicutes bacterium]|nr:2-C-methyl-D-erythritol 4-phosphate cytidylyltransferase [Bacillota bacterium]